MDTLFQWTRQIRHALFQGYTPKHFSGQSPPAIVLSCALLALLLLGGAVAPVRAEAEVVWPLDLEAADPTSFVPSSTLLSPSTITPYRETPRTNSAPFTDVCGSITTNTTWTLTNSPYVVTCDIWVGSGVTLTVGAGVVIKLRDADRRISIDGTLVANGAAEQPVIFTSYRDDVGGDTNDDGGATTAAPGDWKVLSFSGNSSGSALQHVEVRYGGYGWSYGVYVATPNITIHDSTFSYNKGNGIFFENAMPALLARNRFTGNTGAAAWLNHNNATTSLTLADNQAAGNQINGFVVNVNVTGQLAWDGDDAFPFVVNSLGVHTSGQLTLAEGTVLKAQTAGATVSIYGQLLAQGTAARPVVFTSLSDSSVGGVTAAASTDAAPGDWNALVFAGGSSGALQHVEVRYGGHSWSYGLYVGTAAVAISDSTFSCNKGNGIFFENAMPALLARNRFTGNTGAAAWLNHNNATTSLTLADNQAAGNQINGFVVNVNVTGQLTWDGDDTLPFVVEGLGVSASGQFTPTAGTVFKAMAASTTIQVYGRLHAQGTAERPIIFTSLNDSTVGGVTPGAAAAAAPAPGDWNALVINNTSSGSVLEHVQVRYGGHSWSYGLYVGTANVAISDSTFAHNNGKGIFFEGAMPATLARNRFTGNTGAAARLSMVSATSFTLTGNQATGNGINGFEVSTAVNGDVTWDGDPGLPFVVDGLGVARGGRLTLSPGDILKFWYPDRAMGIGGTLIARGTAEQPIYFTSLRDDAIGGDTNGDGSTSSPQPGDWNNLRFEYAAPVSGNVLEHVVVRYGGQYWHENIWVSNTDLTMLHSSSTHAAGAGLSMNAATVYIWNTAFITDHVGVWVSGDSKVRITGSRFDGNRDFGVQNYSSPNAVDARRNWWGHSSGPNHPTLNPAGQGDAVSNGVLFDPWLTAPPAGGGMADGELVLSLNAPRRVSPGGTADYAVFYMNATTRTLPSAVVVLALPDSCQFVDATQGGIHWPELRQVFWRLSDLQPGVSGVLTARVRYNWGLPQGMARPTAAFLVGSGLSSGGLDAAPYLAFTASGPASRTPLTDPELAGLLASRPDMSTLYQESVASGMILGTAETLRFADLSTIVQLGFVSASSGRVTILASDASGASANSYGPDQLSVRTADGGMTTTLSSGAWDFWGAWDPPMAAAHTVNQPPVGFDASPASVDRLPKHPYTQCVLGCLMTKYPKWVATSVNDTLKILNNAKTCLEARFKEDRDAAIKCLNAISLGLPYVGQVIDIKNCANTCVTPANWVKFKCTLGETMEVCGTGGTISGNLYDLLGRNPYQQYVCDENGIWTEGWAQPCGKDFKCIQTMRDGLGSAICMKNVACIGPSLPGATALVAEDAGVAADACTEMFTARDPNAKHGPAGDLLPGEPVTYTVEWENVGDGIAYGVYVTDELSDLFDETTLDLQGNGEYLAATRTIVWDVGELAPKGEPGSTGQITFTVRPRAGLPAGAALVNQAIVFFPSVPERTPTNVVVNVLAPITALSQQVETDADAPVQIVLAGQDPEGAALTFAIAGEPVYGTLTGASPTLTYTPMAGFSGQDRFTYTASNAITTSRPAEVTILVRPSSIADTQPPRVRWTSPANGATDVAVWPAALYTDTIGPVYAPALAITFDEPMDETSLAAALQLQAPGGALIPLAVTWDGTIYRALAAPRQPLTKGSLYTGRVTPAARDAAGNPLAAAVMWTFTTAQEAQPPKVYLPLVLK